jgi:hypothetical protein
LEEVFEQKDLIRYLGTLFFDEKKRWDCEEPKVEYTAASKITHSGREVHVHQQQHKEDEGGRSKFVQMRWFPFQWGNQRHLGQRQREYPSLKRWTINWRSRLERNATIKLVMPLIFEEKELSSWSLTGGTVTVCRTKGIRDKQVSICWLQEILWAVDVLVIHTYTLSWKTPHNQTYKTRVSEP